jgi:hypothetical protein
MFFEYSKLLLRPLDTVTHVDDRSIEQAIEEKFILGVLQRARTHAR